MKKLILLMLFGSFLLAPITTEAQILKKIGKKIKRRTDRKVDKTVDKGLDEVEDEIDGKNKEKLPNEKKADQNKQNQGKTSNNKVIRPWSKFDFVPGDVILFEDRLENEENGEFPSKWDIYKGNVENAIFNGEKIINFPDRATIVPLINKEGDYLPEKFTVEFDVYFETWASYYYLYFYDQVAENGRRPKQLNDIDRMIIRKNMVQLNRFEGEIAGSKNTNVPLWRHVSISFNVRSLKVYLDENRLINIPNLRADPKGISIEAYVVNKYPMFIKNVKIAEGAKKLYDRILTDGKIITTGIKFDSGKSSLRGESMGTINKIYQIMIDYPELKFSVEGHTDNVGADDFNLNLSKQRAETVKNKLIAMGIASERLQSTGYGESKPLYDNSDDVGRANNRRVEFVKL
jgi:outer membrane protein OmpA-like peptidoglycan-associated protein